MKINNLLLIGSIQFLFLSCEDVKLAYPGNNQSTSSAAPVGDKIWKISSSSDDRGQLIENSASGVTIATLTATDKNPDDEFTYDIATQLIDGTSSPYFGIVSEQGEETQLVLVNGNVNYEALSGSKRVVLTISVTDDSPEKQKSTFDIEVDIINENESPYFANINSIPQYADEHVEYSFNKINWSDIDEGDNPTLSSEGPNWLEISDEGLLTGTPVGSDVGINSFIFSISDDEINVDEEKNIEVRSNVAPLFQNAPSSMSIIVGCYDANESIFDLNWSDPNNSTPNFGGNDLVSFTVNENINWLNVDEEGRFFCVDAPTNNDAATSLVELSVVDNRPVNPLTTDVSFYLTVIENEAPNFTNISDFASEISVDETYEFSLSYDDPNEDQVTMGLTFSIGGNDFSSVQLPWANLDNSGNIILTPTSGNTGDYIVSFIISDDCYTVTESQSFTIR